MSMHINILQRCKFMVKALSLTQILNNFISALI